MKITSGRLAQARSLTSFSVAVCGEFTVVFQLNLTTEKAARAHPRPVLCVDPWNSIRQVLSLMRERDQGEALIMRQGELVGLFTERDALRVLAGDGDLSAAVETVMAAPVKCLSQQASVGEAIALMAQGAYRRVPLVDEAGRPQGVLQAKGVLHFLVEHFPTVIYTLPPKPHHSLQQAEGA